MFSKESGLPVSEVAGDLNEPETRCRHYSLATPRARWLDGRVDYKAIVARQKVELEAIYRALRRDGFAFEHPGKAWLAPSPRTEALLAHFAAHGCPVPQSEPDPKVEGIPWDLRFTEYIDLAIAKGGFPGLDFWTHRMKAAQDLAQGE